MTNKRGVEDQVVVITGASSGIGRETALLFAERGARVVIAARSEDALHELAEEIRGRGGRAHVVVTDVSRRQDVEQLGDEAVARFGRIDTWVNNAAVGEWATFEDHDPDEVEAIVQTNLLGSMWGTRTALSRMRPVDSGTIINVGSVESHRSLPLQSAYAATKHGVRAYTRVLRMELMREKSGIDVVLILPASINTPLFEHASSKREVEPRPAPPVYEPIVVAETIVYASRHPRAEMVVGGGGKVMATMERLMPFLADRMMVSGGSMFKAQKSRQANRGGSNLREPSRTHRRTGRWPGYRHSPYTTIFERHPVMRRAVVLGTVAALVLVTLKRPSARY